MSLWNAVCSVLLCSSVRNRTLPPCEKEHLRFAGEFFLSQSAQSSRSFLAHISSSQKAFGIQRTQSVSAIVDTDKEAKSSLHPPHMGISVITPLPFGGGVGGGAAIFLTFVCSVHLCSSVRKNMSFSLCHYVILSKKPHLSPPVPLLFCLQNHHFCYSCPPVTLSSKLPCLPLSLCHSV